MSQVRELGTYVALIAVFIASTGYMTLTLNGRMDSLERRMDRLESKVDALDAKFDQLLIALAGRGVNVSGKPGKNPVREHTP